MFQQQPPARTAPLLVTSTGKKLDLMMPRSNVIDVEDIAHALSNICRWGGHAKQFYSVAEHCILVSRICSDPKWGLMHDAAEAYLGDVVRPLKRYFPLYHKVEQSWLRSVAMAFALPLNLPADLPDCDDAVAMYEASVLLPAGLVVGQLKADALPPMLVDSTSAEMKLHFLRPEDAKTAFLERWQELNHA